MYYESTYPSPIGTIALTSDDKNLVELRFEKSKYRGIPASAKVTQNDELPVLRAAKAWLDRYFAGEQPGILELPLAPIGGAFRQDVWALLCEIPYGKVVTYGDIANSMAKKRGLARMSAQAVGGAVGHNPISIVIPCHRVVGASGSLTGFGGGIETKVKLLEFEGVDMSRLFVPAKGTAL